jgi:FkbM family methyltransferase
LGKIATRIVRWLGADRVEIAFKDGFWTRRVGRDFFPDSRSFEYTYADFQTWNRQMEQYVADAKEYWLQHYVPREGDTIVDVGAGRGEDTVAFSRAVGKTGRVIAIEAHPLTFSIFQRFCLLNGLTNVTALHLALMEKPGFVRIVESSSSWMENAVVHDEKSPGAEVRAATLDEVCCQYGLKDIAFLKMNIEGAERFALPGAGSVIPCIQQIAVACHDFLAERGYAEQFRTRTYVQQFLREHGFTVVSRHDDPRDYVRDHIFGLRPQGGRT